MTLDLARLPEALRDHGLRVVETDGWLTRGYDTVDFVGQMTHHTGGSGPLGPATRDFVIRGRVGANEPNPLPGPLCNSLEGVAAVGGYAVYLIAANRARHAGPGSPVVYAELLRNVFDGRTAHERGLPDDSATHGNRFLFGREVHHPGTGPWSDAILDGTGRSSAALCELAGWSPNRHIGHKHWTARKVDPSWTGSLPDLTRRYLEDDVPLTTEDIAKVAAAVNGKVDAQLKQTETIIQNYHTVTMAAVADLTAKVAAIQGGGAVIDYARLADEVADRLAQRLGNG